MQDANFDPNSGTINAVPLTGTGTPTTLVTGQDGPFGVAVTLQ